MSKDEKSLQKTQQPIQGLTSDEAARLLEENGYNELAGEKKKSVFIVFLEQFKDFLVIILLIAANYLSGAWRCRKLYCYFCGCYNECDSRYGTAH